MNDINKIKDDIIKFIESDGFKKFKQLCNFNIFYFDEYYIMDGNFIIYPYDINKMAWKYPTTRIIFSDGKLDIKSYNTKDINTAMREYQELVDKYQEFHFADIFDGSGGYDLVDCKDCRIEIKTDITKVRFDRAVKFWSDYYVYENMNKLGDMKTSSTINVCLYQYPITNDIHRYIVPSRTVILPCETDEFEALYFMTTAYRINETDVKEL